MRPPRTPRRRAPRRPELVEARFGSTGAGCGTCAGAHVVEEPRDAADGRRVRASVVVDDDHELARVVVADVVQRLPRHAAGERAVADDGDDVPVVLAGHRRTPGRCRRPTTASSRRGSSRRCRARTRSAADSPRGRRLAQRAEVLPAGEELVHVALVPGVEDDRVVAASRRPGGWRSSARRRRGSGRGARRSSTRSPRGTRGSRRPVPRAARCSAHRGRAVRRSSRAGSSGKHLSPIDPAEAGHPSILRDAVCSLIRRRCRVPHGAELE